MTVDIPPSTVRQRPSELAHLNYRPDIDGLRAIAILLVVGFHAFPLEIKGGFIGVDIFFVISGFLISTIILGALDQGVFSFFEFYARRVRRIFPALIAVLAACLLYGWLVFLQGEFVQLGKYVVSAAGFATNFVIWGEAGYFDRAADSKPLLNLWSLGVEEQYYIVWPLLLWFAGKHRWNLLTVTMVAGAVSFALNVGTVHGNAAAAFYSPQTRVWELLVGSVLAYVTLRMEGAFPDSKSRLEIWLGRTAIPQISGVHSKQLHNVQSVLGAGLIALGVLAITRESSFPGWWAVLPSLGAALIIAAGAEAWLNREILSSRVLVWFGLISFPLYLWHWPLLSIARIIKGGEPPTNSVRIAAVVVSVILAWGTYVFIEQPIRKKKVDAKRLLLFCLLMVGVMLAGGLVWKGVIPPYAASFGLENIMRAAGDFKYIGPNFKAEIFQGLELNIMRSNVMSKTLYFGDSNMMQYAPRVDRQIEANPETVNTAVLATWGACPPIPNVKNIDNPECSELVKRSIEYAKQSDVEVIIIGAQWFGYFDSGNPAAPRYFYVEKERALPLKEAEGAVSAFDQLEDMLADFVRSGKKVYLILNIPIGQELSPENIVKRTLWPIGFTVASKGVRKSDLIRRYGHTLQSLLEVGEKSGAVIVNPLDYLCLEELCPALTSDGEPIYSHFSHLNPEYVRTRLLYLDQAIAAKRPGGAFR